MALATSTGRLLTSPPSSMSRESRLTGLNAPGMAMLARIDIDRLPEASTAVLPVLMSQATARYGMGRWLKSMESG